MGCVTLGLSTSALPCGLSLVFGQRCCSLTIWIYFALIFQCRHLIPAKSRAGQVAGFFSALILAHQPMFVKVDWFVLDNLFLVNLLLWTGNTAVLVNRKP